MKKTKAVFTELVLTEDSSKEMVERMQEYAGKLLPNIKAHHITLKFRPSPEEVKSLRMGRTISCVVTGFVSSHRVQAFTCYIGPELKCDNSWPHVTVATGMDGDKAVSPRVSNDVLLNEGITPIPSKFTIQARIGFSDGKEDHFGLEGSIYEEEG